MIQQFAFLTFFLLLSGYMFNRAPWGRYRLEQSVGVHTTLMCALTGFCLWVLSFIILLFLCLNGYDYECSKFVVDVLSLNDGVPVSSFFLLELILLGLLLSVLIPFFLTSIAGMFGISKVFIAQEAFRESKCNPEFTDLLFQSVNVSLPIMFTMKDRKVFIGYPAKLDYASFNDIQIFPVSSGFRDKDELTVKLTTPYKKVIGELNKHENRFHWESFLITVPVREIAHGHLYDFEIESAFNKSSECPESCYPNSLPVTHT